MPIPIAETSTQQQWILYAAAAFIVFYVVIRPMFRRKDPLEKAPSFGLAKQRTVEKEMSNLLVELSEMARQITGQLDTRAAKLELLIQEADRKIAQLQKQSQEPHPATAQQRPAAAENPPPTPHDDPRYAEIYSLADQGSSPVQIAQSLQRPRGEIELILALRAHR